MSPMRNYQSANGWSWAQPCDSLMRVYKESCPDKPQIKIRTLVQDTFSIEAIWLWAEKACLNSGMSLKFISIWTHTQNLYDLGSWTETNTMQIFCRTLPRDSDISWSMSYLPSFGSIWSFSALNKDTLAGDYTQLKNIKQLFIGLHAQEIGSIYWATKVNFGVLTIFDKTSE